MSAAEVHRSSNAVKTQPKATAPDPQTEAASKVTIRVWVIT